MQDLPIRGRWRDRDGNIRGWRWLRALVIVSTVVTACASVSRADGDAPLIRPGLGDFTFNGYAPLKDRPVHVWYAAPADLRTAQILIVMHGVGRDGEDYRADWQELVDTHNVLVLVPEFDEDDYPGAEAYNLGNTVNEDGDALSFDQWSFHIVEALFDYAVREIGTTATDYALFGHSAGAQFVHRFVAFMPEHRARIALAANAGWYTEFNESVAFPYGLDGAPVDRTQLRHAFASDFVLLLGADDTDPNDESLRHDEGSDAQGLNRLDRGLFFYRSSAKAAADDSAEFRWRLIVVPGVAHSHSDMAAIAAPILLGSQGEPKS